MFAPTLSPAYADFGKTVTKASGGSFVGLVKAPSEVIFGDVVARNLSVRYPVASVTLARGDVLTIDSVNYSVIEAPTLMPLGFEAVAALRKA